MYLFELRLSRCFFFFFKQKTAYEIYQCDWSSDVCSSDLWCLASNGDIADNELAHSVSRHIVHDSSGRLARSWIELGSISDALGLSQTNGAQYFHSWIRGSRLLDLARPDPDRLSEALSQVDAAVVAAASATPLAADADDLVAETKFTGALISHGLRRLDVGTDASQSRLSELNAEVTMLWDAHMACWRARSRDGGLQDSLSRLLRPG